MKVISASGYLPEESKAEIARLCGDGIKYSYEVPKKFTESLMAWATTPKASMQDEPGANG